MFVFDAESNNDHVQKIQRNIKEKLLLYKQPNRAMENLTDKMSNFMHFYMFFSKEKLGGKT